VLLVATFLLGGCSGTRNPADPLEPINRGIYKFNDGLDQAVIKPVAKGYRTMVPLSGRIMVSNFVSNLDDVLVTINDLLQLKFSQAASDGSRFLINSTFGVFGLFNVASRLEKHDEDFGQTLGYWGVGPGPYVVLPFLGPSSIRDGSGWYIDGFASVPYNLKDMSHRNLYYFIDGVQYRASLLDQEKVLREALIDPYEFMRDAYLLRRKSLVYDGNLPRARYDDF
jgi:phospholipid-binding lipoprotein MlaA